MMSYHILYPIIYNICLGLSFSIIQVMLVSQMPHQAMLPVTSAPMSYIISYHIPNGFDCSVLVIALYFYVCRRDSQQQRILPGEIVLNVCREAVPIVIWGLSCVTKAVTEVLCSGYRPGQYCQ